MTAAWNRRRRLRRTLGVLAVVAVAAVGVGWFVHSRTRPRTYRPGEELSDISSRLERGRTADAPEPELVDVTAAAGLAGFRSFVGERSSQIPEDMGGGAAFGDYDGDGDDDLFLVAAGAALDRPAAERASSELYENLGDGRFRRASGFPELRILGMAAAWGDADGDGRPDLVVTGYGTLELFLNRGGGRFEPAPGFARREGYWSGVAWGDFDRDGDLDLYVCGYVRYREDAADRARSSKQFGREAPFTLNPASYDPEPNLLLVNDGSGRFSEAAASWGVANPGGRSLAAVWHDFDGDGRLDLYVANDISDNALYLNRGDWFEDASHAARVADYRGAMGLAVGDWNRDGDDDLFITHWLAQENALYDSRLADVAAPDPDAPAPETRRPAFMDLSAPLGLGQVALPYVGWGAEFADFDADGWLDLAVVNGSTLELAGQPRLEPQPPFLFWNRRGDHFVDLAPSAPALAEPHVGRGLAVSDFDRDGDLDLLLVHHEGGALLLRNDMQTGHWLELDLRDRPRRPDGGRADAEGAVVVAHLADALLRRSVVGGASYLSQSTKTLHFGLGAAQRVERLEVRWPDGGIERFDGLEADTRWEIRRGEAVPRRVATVRGTEGVAGGELDDRQRVLEFWRRHREGMDAMKRRGDVDAAIEAFRAALALDPSHGDARYYLANCLAARGETDAALEQLGELVRADPGSHRGHKQWGVLRAATASSREHLAQARAALERALELNREETGSLLALGELALLEGREEEADRVLALATRTNPRAVGGLFLRSWLAWKRGDRDGADELLAAARAALGPDWKPAEAAAEGDVESKMHVESGPLEPVWERWDGNQPPPQAFTALERLLAERRAGIAPVRKRRAIE